VCCVHVNCPPALIHGTPNQRSCSAERPSLAETQHPKGRCMELGNWSIESQLGSTNSKSLPVLFQGSHQGLLPNSHQLLCSPRHEPWACPWSPGVPVKRSGSWLSCHRPTKQVSSTRPQPLQRWLTVPVDSPLPRQGTPPRELSSCPTSKPRRGLNTVGTAPLSTKRGATTDERGVDGG